MPQCNKFLKEIIRGRETFPENMKIERKENRND